MPDQLPEEIKARRLEQALALLNQHSLARNRAYLDRTVEVLVNCEDAKGDSARHSGRTRQNKIVHFSGEGVEDGSVVSVTITGASPLYLQGDMVCR